MIYVPRLKFNKHCIADADGCKSFVFVFGRKLQPSKSGHSPRVSNVAERLQNTRAAHPHPEARKSRTDQPRATSQLTLDLHASNDSSVTNHKASKSKNEETRENATKTRPQFFSMDSSISLGLTGDSADVTQQLPVELKQQLSIEVRSQSERENRTGNKFPTTSSLTSCT